MYSCKDMLDDLADYLDDEGTAALRRELEEHVSVCTICRVVYDSTRKTIRVVTESRSFELPPSVSERLRRRIMRQLREEEPPRT